MKILSSVPVVLRKDFRSFWPQASLTALLMILSVTLIDSVRFIFVAGLLHFASFLASAFLLLAVVQDDAVVSTQHDWLVRPVPRVGVLIAKLIFVLGSVIAPVMLGVFINGLLKGYPIAEALSSAGAVDIETLLCILLGVALGSITANMRQAALLFVGVAIAVVATTAIDWRPSIMMSELNRGGLGWILSLGVETVAVVLAIAVLWSQYARRNTVLSYKILLVSCSVLLGGLLLPWSGYAALQRWFTPASDAEALTVDLTKGCFASTNVGSLGTESAANFPPAIRMESDRRIDPNSIVFATTLQQPELPKDQKFVISRVAATFLDGNRNMGEMRPVVPPPDRRRDLESRRLFRNYWFLNSETYEKLADLTQLQIRFDYTFGLLEPERSIEIAADGSRAFYDGIGYCGATAESSREIAVNCFIPNAQPALLTAEFVGDATSMEGRSRAISNFAPAAFDFIGGERHRITLVTAGTQSPRVKITTYQVRAFFDRSLTAPGVLGGPKASCPAPTLK